MQDALKEEAHAASASSRLREVARNRQGDGVSYGVPQEDIRAGIVGCSHVTLRQALCGGTGGLQESVANAKVAETCYKMAVSGNVPAATFFWLKTRARWQETNATRFVDSEGNDRETDVKVVIQYPPEK